MSFLSKNSAEKTLYYKHHPSLEIYVNVISNVSKTESIEFIIMLFTTCIKQTDKKNIFISKANKEIYLINGTMRFIINVMLLLPFLQVNPITCKINN